jgi:protein O-GlcNAc transferase
MAQLTIQQAFDLALQHHQAGRLREAEILYRQIVSQEPENADAMHLLGLIAHRSGKYDAAADLIRRAIALHPNFPQAYVNLGNVLKDLGKLDGAIEANRRALALDPSLTGAHCNLGNALMESGQLDEAIVAYRNAVAAAPKHALAHSNLGNALREAGDPADSVASCRQAIALDPNLPEAHCHLGNALMHLRRFDEAIESYRAAITLDPDYAQAHSNLSSALNQKGRLDDAIAASHRAIELKPGVAEACNNLGNALKDSGQLDEAIAAYRKALESDPGFVIAHDNLLFSLLYHPSSTPRDFLAESDHWNRIHAQPLRRFIKPVRTDIHIGRRLRIGYVSPHFCNHPVGRFILPLLALHDREAFEAVCYSQVLVPDEITAKLQASAPKWRGISGLSDEKVAEIIRADEIDVLVDLAMHTENNRLLVFARKPAPVQVTYLAYAGGTALEAIDYRLTDRFLDPDESDDKNYKEESIRLDGTYWCYQPNADTPPVNELPALAKPAVTFGCLNALCKLSDPTLSLWAEVLRECSGSRLLLVVPQGSARERILRRLARDGIGAEQIEFAPRQSLLNYLRTYQAIDIALDPFPYGGGTTTCDALWMGVPVVTLVGQTAVGRAGVSIMSNAGLPELIAGTPRQYVQIARGLAEDLPRLAVFRQELRPKLLSSPLMDAPRFARSIEAAYRQMWRTWCDAASACPQ